MNSLQQKFAEWDSQNLLARGEADDTADKEASIYDVRKIVGILDPLPLSAFGTDLQY